MVSDSIPHSTFRVPHSDKRVVVAMSGGVDSSVTAALLKEQGYEVIGITMQVWDHSRSADAAGTGSCCSLDDVQDARRVAEQLEIPFFVVNFEEEFRLYVIDDFVAEYRHGRTPNPCVRCNQLIKFDLLLRKGRELGAEFIATGHYARSDRDEAGCWHLRKGLDPAKDQSYFLFTLTQEQLAASRFPLGGLTKPQVRELAARFALRTAEKGESQEICFIPDDDYVRFLEEEGDVRGVGGEIVDRRGTVLGRHSGIHRYTVGQRKGLGIAHPHPLYVLELDPVLNRVVVGGREELMSNGLVAANVNWIVPPGDGPVEALCKIRYRHRPVPCTVFPLDNDSARVRFAAPEKAVTPGQAVVFYRDDEVLGGGWIEGVTE